MKQRSIKRRLARAAKAKRKQPADTHRDGAGRLHLVLHRDPATGGEQVELEVPVFKETWQNEITQAAANTVRGVLHDEPSLERLLELARGVMASTSRLAEGLLARAPAGTVACKAGCDHCCYQSVGVTPPEALAIFDHVKRTLPSAALVELTARVAERYEKTRGLSSAERFSPEHPCVFLEAGRCSIYPVRPLSCRGMNSLDAEECKTRLHQPEARAAFLERGAGSHSYLEPIRAFHSVSAGLQLGLSELYGLDMRALDLVAAMQLLLSEPNQIPEAWLGGQTVFAPARGGDSSESFAILELSGTAGLPKRER